MSACLHVCLLAPPAFFSAAVSPSPSVLRQFVLHVGVPWARCRQIAFFLLALCRGPALGCSFWAWVGTQLYDSFLSWSISCRCLASRPFPSLLDSFALRGQDDLGSIMTFLHSQHWFALVPCYHMLMQGLGCMCLRPCGGSLLYIAHTCF